MARCQRCQKPGIPYVYRDQEFDGLIAYHHERLCSVCVDEDMNRNGINILVIDDRPSIPPYVYNSVRDADKVTIWIPPELRGIDGRDVKLSKRRKGK